RSNSPARRATARARPGSTQTAARRRRAKRGRRRGPSMALLPRFVPNETRREGAHQRGEAIVEGSERARIALRRRDKAPGDEDDNPIDGRADDDEAEAERKQLCARIGVARADELRQEGDEEQHYLRIGEIDKQAVREGAAEAPACRSAGLQFQRRAITERAPSEPEQIERAGDLDGLVGVRRGREQRGEAERGGESMDDEPGERPRERRKTLSPAAGQRPREENGHIRAGRRREQEAGDDIGRRQRGTGEEGGHAVRAPIADSTSARRGKGATAP